MQDAYYAQIVVGVVLVCIGLFVLVHGPTRRSNQLFCFFIWGLGAWSILLSLLLLTGNFWYSQFVVYCDFPIFGGLFLFSSVYPDRKELPRYALLGSLPLLAVIAFSSTGAYIKSMERGRDGAWHPINGPYVWVFATATVVYLCVSLALFVRHYLRAQGRERTQLSYLLLGVGVSAAATALGDALLPAFGIFSYILLGPSAAIVMATAAAYAIVRHQLLDIRVVIQRGLIYSALLALVVSSYSVILSMLAMFFQDDPDRMFSSAVATTLIGILTVPRLEKQFRKITDTIFFKDTYDYAQALRTLTECLYASIDINELIYQCEHHLTRILRAEKVSMVQGSEVALGAVLSIPIMSEDQVVGNIFLGAKRSGDDYTVQDKHLLETFALQASTALARATLYEQVKEHAAELEDKVEQRTQELKQLQEDQRHLMLDISHNLQTPLTVLQTKLETLKATTPEDPGIRALEVSISELSVFINDFLRLARLENSAEEPHINVDFSALLSDLLEEVDIIAADRGIRLESTLAADVHVKGDANKLREAVVGLLSNSIKYMRDDGERTISVSLAKDGGTALLTITDTGIGIAPGDLPHIFDRFWRAKGSEHISGSGLGLALARHIAERHGGSLEADSVWGQSTTLLMRLPLIS